eukprot:TRINITY_DN422_c0_g2_i1.p2 TRINITY_DN422_c0_g2~~TRINITY_DN422_c0_g2_i1.p2  ORF type:complete len:111 (+),score=15.05 TRINITY_DN422_c0_g2_i1:233-565(+)
MAAWLCNFYQPSMNILVERGFLAHTWLCEQQKQRCTNLQANPRATKGTKLRTQVDSPLVHNEAEKYIQQQESTDQRENDEEHSRLRSLARAGSGAWTSRANTLSVFVVVV